MDDDRAGTRIAIALVIGIVCMTAGGFLLYDGYQSMTGTEEVDALVVDSDVSGASGTEREFRVHISYEYSYEGESYTSDNIYPNRDENKFSNQGNAESFLEDYPEGETVTAYVNPDDPSEAHLESGIRLTSLLGYLALFLIGAITFIIGLNEYRSR